MHGGEARGRRLLTPRGIRPTQGLVAEAIFNVLGARVLEAEILDLFAGSGALGIEALSRGAGHATFVDSSEESLRVIGRNLETLGYQDRARLARSDAVRWVRAHPGDVRRAGIVFLDPPYRDAGLDDALRALDAVVAEGALVVAEHWDRHPWPDLERLRVTRDRRYGGTSVTIASA